MTMETKIELRVSEREKRRIKRAARVEKTTVSELARQALLREAAAILA